MTTTTTATTEEREKNDRTRRNSWNGHESVIEFYVNATRTRMNDKYSGRISTKTRENPKLNAIISKYER